VIVSDDHKFIFLAIPKTASGVCQDFLQHFGWVTRREAEFNHLTADQVIAKVGRKKWDEYRKMVFIRNPWDRYVSLFLWVRRYNRQKKRRATAVQYEVFADYVNSGGEHGQHQRDFVFDSTGKVIVDYVGRFEHLYEDICGAARLIGQPPPEAIGHTNKNANNGRVHYTEYYTEQWMIDAVAERERFLIETFGYKYGEDGERWRT
jgi:hypothetical protein